jgi:hypothetical protein
MRLKQYLKEKYKDGFMFKFLGKDRGIWVEIFENPSNKELTDATKDIGLRFVSNQVRFVALMQRKKVLAWNVNITHDTVLREWLKMGSTFKPELLQGIAGIVSGKWAMTNSDLGVTHNLKKFTVKDWEWANRYINVTDYLTKYQRNLGNF